MRPAASVQRRAPGRCAGASRETRGLRYRRRLCLASFSLPFLAACGAEEVSGGDRPLDWHVRVVATLQAPDGAMTPIPWGVVADPGARRIYALDPPNHRVLVFDGDGAHLSEFGRPGGGPGEFEQPWSLALRPDGTLSVLDSGSGRIARLTPEGEWLGAEPLLPSFYGPGHADLGDRLVMVTAPMTDDPLLIRQELVSVQEGGVAILGTTDQRQTEATLPCLSRRVPVPKPVAPEPVWTTYGDTVIAVTGIDYLLDLYENGERIGSFARPVPPVEVTEPLVVEGIEAGQLRLLMKRCGIDAATVAGGMDWQETVAPVQRIAVAPDGRLWVTRTGQTRRHSSVDVLARDGSYVGTLDSIPSPITFLTPSRFVGSSLDEYLGTSLKVVEVEVD